MMTQPARAVIYCRTACSPGMEKDDALHAQEKECRAYAKTHGMEVTGIYYDSGISGMTADRPGWQTMMHALKNALAPHGVLISDISRLARDFELCDRLQDECKRLGHTITMVDDRAAVPPTIRKKRGDINRRGIIRLPLSKMHRG